MKSILKSKATFILQKATNPFLAGCILLMLLAGPGCSPGADNTKPGFDQFQFDQRVIDKLPLYDSLAAAILQKLPLFIALNGNDSNAIFSYLPQSLRPEVFKRLPAEAGTAIDDYFARLGQDFVYGFDVFTDSSIKIYVRERRNDSLNILVQENLSFYPEGTGMKQRKFPVKDTALNNRWQYWVRVSKPEFF